MSHSNTKPAFIAPPNACDSHFHVFGPAGQYGYGTELRYEPPHAPLEDYLELARCLGLTRFVFVQPSAYGRDNRCMLDAMKQMTLPCRGIVDIDEDEPDNVLGNLDALGVRGVRINVRPIMPAQPGFGDTLAPRIRRLAARCSELGWHLDFLLPDWLTVELLPVLRSLRLPFSIAHLGMQKAKNGADAADFQHVLDLARNNDCYLKITGIYRISTAPGFADVGAMVQAALDAVPDRLIWGSDYPHLSFDENSSVDLFNLLGEWVPDAAMRQKILADNPARLYGF